MVEYLKIETVYNRDTDGSKKLVEGSWRNETVKFLANNNWIFTEKIDGTNIGIYWDGHEVHFQGRTERAQIPTHLLDYLMTTFKTSETEEMFEQLFGESEVILFGEGYGPKIQNGGNYRDTPSFILFDVYFVRSNLWLRRESVEDIAQSFGIDVVPIILTGTIQDAIDFVKTKPKSTIGTANMEGVVGRPAVEILDRRGNRVIVKVKVHDFT